ncbi:MAG: hypothetical protein NDI69_16075 [Bacteriovoracaceae bacterium]|nr:hypothetical protein [Bacteriovoracaceae bacterium]
MNYYLISSQQDLFDSFRSRMTALRNAVLIEDEQQLKIELGEVPGNAFFLIHFVGLNEMIDEWVLEIRERAPYAKVLYITEDNNAHDLKAHQLTPVGGDAYVHSKISEKDFNQILETLKAPEIVNTQNRLEIQRRSNFSNIENLAEMKNHPMSAQIDELFKSVIQTASKKPQWQSLEALLPSPSEEEGESVGIKDQELSLDDGEELEISLDEDEAAAPKETPLDEGMELSLDDDNIFELGEIDMKEPLQEDQDQFGELSLDDAGIEELEEIEEEEEGEELSLSEDDEDFFSLDENEPEMENLGELSFDEAPEITPDDGLSLELGGDDLGESLDLTPSSGDALSLGGEELEESLDFSQSTGDELSLGDEEGLTLDLSDDQEGSAVADHSLSFDTDREMDLSEDAKEKLKEIDAILDYDASQVQIRNDLMKQENLDEPLVSEDLELGNLGFEGEEALSLDSTEEVELAPAPPKEDKPKRKKKEAPERGPELGSDLREISQAYSGEMERMQATISNLRTDREELLAKIQTLEEGQMLHGRQTLGLRAELDEKKIELTIIRRKLNDEINELKDKVKLFDEKRLILEEKNRILAQELDKAGQKNKIDVKKVQMRERELEQKLELLKSDAETQIRNRDLKILELKRKIDAMEFDMESISLQEKRSVESRFELEDKLDKAIKTLRSAITVLEDETDRSSALDALKKNIDM